MALIDRVKCDVPDALVWKWPSESLTTGAQLIVNESQQAVFVKGGKALDLFGPGTHTLAAANLPVLQHLINLPFGGRTPFTAEVWFVNRVVSPAMDWGTKTPIMLLDPKYRVTVPLRSYGRVNIRVASPREFVVEVAGVAQRVGVAGAVLNLLEGPIVSCVQQALGDYLAREQICVLDLPSHTLAFGKRITGLIDANFRSFGIEITSFAVESINFDAKDDSVRKLREMLNEAARLETLGDAARRNIDFYRMDKQYSVLQSAAESGHGESGVMEAIVGVGLGLGLARPLAQTSRDAMAPVQEIGPACPKCSKSYPPGSKFCSSCGTPIHAGPIKCPGCSADNVPSASYCAACGTPLAQAKCAKCNAMLPRNAKFCPACGGQQ